jgi:hypothetical protein
MGKKRIQMRGGRIREVRNGKEYLVQNEMEEEWNKKLRIKKVNVAVERKLVRKEGGVGGGIGESVGARVKKKVEVEGKGRKEDDESEGGYNCG